MLTPNPAGPPAYTISDLDRTQNAKTALAGALIETEILTGQGGRKNTGTSLEDLADFLEPFFGKGGAGFSYAFRPNGDLIASPELADYLDNGGEFYWISPDASGNRQAVNMGTSPTNTPQQNSTAINSTAAGLSTP